ncbi:MAG: LysR family transcriptional regulator [Myxococcales bacterium]
MTWREDAHANHHAPLFLLEVLLRFVMNEEWLRSFLAFAEHLSFTTAAEALHLSQPAVHVQVKKLSDSLGFTLYRRDGRRLILTPEGERVYAFGREQAERTERFLGDLRGRPEHRPVVLSAGAGAYQYLLGDAIRTFTRSGLAPLRLASHDRDQAVRAVQRGDSHLGVAVLEATPDELASERLVQVGASLVMPKSHRLARKRGLTLKDLKGERLIVPPEGRPHRTMLSRALLSAGVPWQPAIEASGWELLMHFARLELGIAVVNSFCAPPAGCVRRALPAIPRVTYSLFRNRTRRMDGAVAALRDAIIAHTPRLLA